jgi:hypothetical protein
MPITITEHGFNPDEPDRPFRRFAAADSTGMPASELEEPSPWVEPDYTTVAKDAELEGGGPFYNWPGPPVVMPAGLLPDGKPWGGDDMENSFRIEGVRPRNSAEADACVRAYLRQQDLLRNQAGIELEFRVRGGLRDTPEAYAAIIEVHRRERARRRRMAG